MTDDGILTLTPNIERRHLTREWRVTVSTNSDGLRDRLIAASSKTGTVLGLGDSMAFGWGVEVEESFYFLAEETLRPHSVRIVKAGIPGTGTIDQLRWLRRYGERYNPNLLVLSFFVGNDFVDNQMGGVPAQFIVRDGLMVRKRLDSTPQSALSLRDISERLKRSSLLAQKTAELVWYFENTNSRTQELSNHPGLNSGDRWLWEFMKVHLKRPPSETLRGIDLTLQSLDGIHGWSQQHQITLILLIIPRSFQIYDWELTKWKQAYQLRDEDIDLDRPQRVLAEWAAKNDVAVVDLLPRFRMYQATHSDDRLFFYPDAHLNTKGHAQTAAILAEFLKKALRVKTEIS